MRGYQKLRQGALYEGPLPFGNPDYTLATRTTQLPLYLSAAVFLPIVMPIWLKFTLRNEC